MALEISVMGWPFWQVRDVAVFELRQGRHSVGLGPSRAMWELKKNGGYPIDFRPETSEIAVRCDSMRMQTFLRHGPFCYICGIEGKTFRLMRHSQKDVFHLGLFADGRIDEPEVLMTRDHLVPVSKGGLDSFDNQRPCCFPCNQKKGDSYP